MDAEGKSLLLFEKDSMNPMHEGYIGFWSVSGVAPKQFRFRKRTSRTKALDQWNHLIKNGWRVVEERQEAA